MNENNLLIWALYLGEFAGLLQGKMTSKQSSNKNLEGLIKPYGGELINLMASDQEAKDLKNNSYKKLNCSGSFFCRMETLVLEVERS